jgi:F-type H+-transporting ATPase subunit delta
MSAGSDARMSELDKVLDAAGGGDSLASDLFAVVDALDSSVALRRALTDPSTPEKGRKTLAHGLLDGKVSAAVADLVGDAVTLRWAGGRTFAAALERQAVRAELIRADAAGQLEETEDALFRFARLVESTPELRNALSDRNVGVTERQSLVGDLLDGKASDTTIALAKRAVGARERTFGHTIEGYVTMAAAQKNRVVATVRVAMPLTDDQLSRLQAALSKQVGRDVAVQVIIDETVIGGVRVELGDEIIEGTVSDRLADAKRLFS